MEAWDGFYKEYSGKELILADLPTLIADKYEICACIKQSEVKQVYLIKSKLSFNKYILKRVSSQCHENLEDEYIMHKAMLHPGLVSAVEFIRDKQYSYLIREYIEGSTITELVEMTKTGCLPEDKVTDIALQVCHVLKYLHGQNPPVIHRDIKPENIIVTKEGKCKLIDFGISRRYQSERDKDTVIMGTQYSSAPEQYGFKQTDARSDIYSIGILMYYMATGSLDIREINEYQIAKKIRRCILKCTQFSPDKRYETVKQLESRLERGNNCIDKRKITIAGLGGIALISILTFTSHNIISNHFVSGQYNINKTHETLNRSDKYTGQKENSNNPNPTTGLYAKTDTYTDSDASPKVAGNTDVDAKTQIGKVPTAGSDVGSSKGIQAGIGSKAPVTGKSKIKSNSAKGEMAASDNAKDTKEDTRESSKTSSTAVDKNSPYKFKSDLIEAAVRSELGKSKSDTVTYADLDSIYELYICGRQVYSNWNQHFVYGDRQYMQVQELTDSGLYNQRGDITSLSDLSNMKNLQIIALYKQNISDLSPLKKIKNLTCLGLGSNKIMDLRPLKDLRSLETLDVSGNPIFNDDVTVIAKLPSLERLDLGDTKITKLTMMKNIRLKCLSIFGDRLGDCDGIDKLTMLEELTTTGINNTITEKGLKNITKLKGLTLLKVMGGDGFDLSMLQNMTSLEYLDLCGCQIKNLKGLEGLKLVTLLFSETPVTDISALTEIPTIQTLGIDNIPCIDFKPILSLHNLKNLTCKKRQVQELKNQLGKISFTITNMDFGDE